MQRTVTEHGGSLSVGVAGVLGEKVDAESRDGDLSSDVAELADETEDGVLTLPEGTVVDETAVLLGVLEVVAGDLGELGEEEEDGNGGTEAGDGEVDVLDRGELDRVGVLEEGVGGDGGSDEGGETVERLGEVEAEGSALRDTEDGDVRAVGEVIVSSCSKREKGRKSGKREKGRKGKSTYLAVVSRVARPQPMMKAQHGKGQKTA
jgi:hypothetical protein